MLRVPFVVDETFCWIPKQNGARDFQFQGSQMIKIPWGSLII